MRRIPETPHSSQPSKQGKCPLSWSRFVRRSGEIRGVGRSGSIWSISPVRSFNPPKRSSTSQRSKGQQLTGPTSSTSTASSASASAAALSRLPPLPYVVHSSSPTTVLQVVTADRRKLRETLNEDTTVSALYRHVAHVAPLPPPPFPHPHSNWSRDSLLDPSVTALRLSNKPQYAERPFNKDNKNCP